jgi:hypothetical protein
MIGDVPCARQDALPIQQTSDALDARLVISGWSTGHETGVCIANTFTIAREVTVMKSLFSNAAALFVAAHGLIHVLGFAAYTGIALVPGLPYKTTLFGGAIDVGTNGIAVFGLLWGIVAVGHH